MAKQIPFNRALSVGRWRDGRGQGMCKIMDNQIRLTLAVGNRVDGLEYEEPGTWHTSYSSEFMTVCKWWEQRDWGTKCGTAARLIGSKGFWSKASVIGTVIVCMFFLNYGTHFGILNILTRTWVDIRMTQGFDFYWKWLGLLVRVGYSFYCWLKSVSKHGVWNLIFNYINSLYVVDKISSARWSVFVNIVVTHDSKRMRCILTILNWNKEIA